MTYSCRRSTSWHAVLSATRRASLSPAIGRTETCSALRRTLPYANTVSYGPGDNTHNYVWRRARRTYNDDDVVFNDDSMTALRMHWWFFGWLRNMMNNDSSTRRLLFWLLIFTPVLRSGRPVPSGFCFFDFACPSRSDRARGESLALQYTAGIESEASPAPRLPPPPPPQPPPPQRGRPRKRNFQSSHSLRTCNVHCCRAVVVVVVVAVVEVVESKSSAPPPPRDRPARACAYESHASPKRKWQTGGGSKWVTRWPARRRYSVAV